MFNFISWMLEPTHQMWAKYSLLCCFFFFFLIYKPAPSVQFVNQMSSLSRKVCPPLLYRLCFQVKLNKVSPSLSVSFCLGWNRLSPWLVAEGRHGGYPGLSLPPSDGRPHDTEVDAQSTYERLGWRFGLWTKVMIVMVCLCGRNNGSMQDYAAFSETLKHAFVSE